MSNLLKQFSRKIKLLVVLSPFMLVGCASQIQSGNVYRENEALRSQAVEMGIVESVRNITIQGTNSGVGGATGAVIGGVAGSNVGGGSGRILGSVIGAVAGGVVGQKAENAIVTRPGLEITVRLDSGSLRAIVQDADTYFSAGQRVRVVTQNGKARVTF